MCISGLKMNRWSNSIISRYRRLQHEGLERRDLFSSQGLDVTFGHSGFVETPFANGAAFAQAAVVQGDGKILVSGGIAKLVQPGGNLVYDNEFVLTRYNPDGSLDGTFGTNGVVILTHPYGLGEGVSHLALQSDGKIVAATGAALLRLNTNGSLDETFGNHGFVSTVATSWVAVQSDGKIVGGGIEMERFNADGTLDTTFGVNGVVFSPGSQFVLAADGKIITVAGDAIQRFASDGKLDGTFGSGGSVTVPTSKGLSNGGHNVALSPDGRIYWVGGVVLSNQGTWQQGIEVARFNADGSIDQTFGDAGQTTIGEDSITDPREALLQTDGKLVVVGRSGAFDGFSGPGNFAGAIFTARLDVNGALDPTWGEGGKSKIIVNNSVDAFRAAQASNGQIVIAGETGPLTADPQSHAFLVARLDGDFTRSFVQHAFHDLLGRDAEPGALGYFVTHINNGSLTRAQAVQLLQGSVEYRQNVVRQTYQTYLGRDADPTGLASWTAYLVAGGTREELQLKILASGEFYIRVCGADRNVFLNELFLALLDRPIDPGGQAAFGFELLTGGTRASVVASVLHSVEYEQRSVDSLYSQLLTRDPDAGGLAFFQSQLAAGGSLDRITASLAASDEYFAGL